MTDTVQVTIVVLGRYIWTFEWHTYISPLLIVKVKIKVMHISTENILEIVTDRKALLLPSNRKSYIGVRLAYSHLTLTHFKDADQGHAYFTSEYQENGERYNKH